MAKQVRVAVIGTGNMGRHHVRNYAVMPEASLVGIADVNPQAKELASEHKTAFFSDYKKMIETLKPEAVSIVVPTPMHLEVGSFCFQRGIHCLIEKPIAYSLEDADALIKLAQSKKLILTIGHIERFNPIIRKINQIIKDGTLGEVLAISCRRVGGFPTIEPKTDVIIDLAVHDIDIISFLLNKHPKRISSHGSRTHHSNKIDAAEILLDYGRAAGIVQANWVTPVKVRTISVTGSGGYLEGNYITQELEIYRHNMENVRGGFPSFVASLGEAEKEVVPLEFEEPLAVELKAFLEAIQDGKTTDIVSPKDAREALSLALQAVELYE